MKRRAGRSPKVVAALRDNALVDCFLTLKEKHGFDSLVEFIHDACETADTLSSYVYRKRMEANITQKQLCLSLGFTSQQYFSNLERGQSLLAPKYFAKLSQLINCSYDEIMALYFIEIIKREVRKVQ